MSQFAARDQANTLAAPPHPEAEDPSAPLVGLSGSNPQRPRLTAANFRRLKQKLNGKKGEDRPAGAAKPLPAAAPSSPKHLFLLVEPPVAGAGGLETSSTEAADTVEPSPEPPEPPEPASAPPASTAVDLSGPPPFDLMSLKEESDAPLALTLSPLLTEPEPVEFEPEVFGAEIAREVEIPREVEIASEPEPARETELEFPEHRQNAGETGIEDLASLIGNASPLEMEPVEEESLSIAQEARDLRLILEPAVPTRDEFGTTDIGEAFAAPRAPAPSPAQLQPLDDTARTSDFRPTDYRFWENPGEAPPAVVEERSDPPAMAIDEPALLQAPVEIGPHQAPAPETPEREVQISEARRRVLSRPLEEPSEEVGEVARTLIEIMSLPTNATQPQERALAADTLLHLIPRMPVKNLVAMAERLSVMEAPPALVLAQLIHDRRIEIAGPLLEKCSAIADHDLIEVMADRNEQSNRMIARRRHLTPILCDALIATGDSSAILTLVRNPGASLTHEAFHRLNEFAREHPSLQAPLATRADLPAPVAFELFWVLPAELRRYVISRFLTDSSTLGKILKLTMRIDGETESPVAARFSTPEETDRLIAAMTSGSVPETERTLADALGLNLETAAKIVADAHGEPLCVALKALGVTRGRFEEIVAAAKTGAMHVSTGLAELQGFFESLSFNKARVLLTYWDWGVLGTGPYTAVPA